MKRFRREITALALLLIVTIGLGSAAKPRSREPQTQVVVIEGMKFSPARARIQIGDTVEFRNSDLVPHNVTERGAGRFDSGMINRGETWKFVAGREGTFEYRCNYHPDMMGTIVVGEISDLTARSAPTVVELCGGF
jgi:plastocyanin